MGCGFDFSCYFLYGTDATDYKYDLHFFVITKIREIIAIMGIPDFSHYRACLKNQISLVFYDIKNFLSGMSFQRFKLDLYRKWLQYLCNLLCNNANQHRLISKFLLLWLFFHRTFSNFRINMNGFENNFVVKSARRITYVEYMFGFRKITKIKQGD